MTPERESLAETRAINIRAREAIGEKTSQLAGEAIKDEAMGGQLERLWDEYVQEIRQRSDEAENEAIRELRLPATLLVGERPELFAEVDRMRAEGELRLAVVPPLTALIILLAILHSVVWLVGLVAVALLLIQGIRREEDSRKIIADAITFGRIESPSIKRFEAWADSLPDRYERDMQARFAAARPESS